MTLPLLGLLAVGWADPVRDETARGIEAYDARRYEAALTSFLRAEERSPDRPLLSFNVAAALYQQKRYEEALAAYERSREDPATTAASFYGAGNALFRMGKLPEAAELYKQALRRDPTDVDAKHNLEIVQQRIDESKNQEQDRENERDSEGGKEEKEQQEERRSPSEEEESRPEEPSRDEKPDQSPEQKISPQDAERILAALAEEEEELRRESMEKLRAKRKAGAKDW
jgi:tetratricopeptide (TPR) repeat protein